MINRKEKAKDVRKVRKENRTTFASLCEKLSDLCG